MDKGGLSLRKKKSSKPKISAPRPVGQDAPATNDTPYDGNIDNAPAMPRLQRTETSQSSLRGRQANQGDRTADLVKRRYSTRFVGQPFDAGLAPPMPSMPNLPAQYQAGSSAPPSRDGGSPERGGRGIKVDTRALRDPNLQPEQYVATVLAEADEADILKYQAELRKLKNRTSTDLQHNVYQNRTQFIKISKEADRLKTEMRTLRSLMSDLTGALHQAASAAGAETNGLSVADRKRSNRSSVANLEALWSTHLQALWKRVEGSQKYLPAIPGRHIVHESGRWVELNAATWKPRRRVHIILLNDHLLIASEKKRNDSMPNLSPNLGGGRRQSVYAGAQPNQSVLVAERCWPLQDVQMADIGRTNIPTSRDERSTIANAVNVRVGTESWTFATASSADNSGEKAALLVAFKKSSEELRKMLAAEHGEREKALDELAHLTASNNPSRRGSAWSKLSSSSSPLMGSGGSDGVLNRSSTLIDVDGRQQGLRWVEQQIDGLDIDIALQRFEEAVARTEKLRKLARSIRGNAMVQEVILGKIDERANKLATVLARRLRGTNSAMSATKENVAWLVRLGCDEMARNAYLQARTEVVRRRTRQLPFTGSLPPHLTALSYITFTLILHTLRVYNTSFPPTYSSAVIKWAKDRVEEFNASLDRQLSSVEKGSELWKECREIVLQNIEVLGEVGVDFRALVARALDGEMDVEAASRNKASEGRASERAPPARSAAVPMSTNEQTGDARRGPAGPRRPGGPR